MAGDSPKVKAFSCPSCAAALKIRGLGQTSTLACEACSAIIDISGDEYKVLRKSQDLAIRPCIQLGSRGKLFGDLFEVIGFMVKTDATGIYPWREYLLFNPYKGFRWLVESNGHWSFVEMLTERPGENLSGEPLYEGRTFKHFLSGKARVKFVLGEFYWQVGIEDTVAVADYIAPPLMLSWENDGKEETWSLGVYLTASEVEAAFPNCEELPQRKGVAPHQPSPYPNFVQLMVVYIIAFFLLTSLQIQYAKSRSNQSVFSGSFDYSVSNPNKLKTTRAFDLNGATSNVSLAATSGVRNSWLEVEASLVNSSTGESYDVPLEMAYYYGRDSDGSWSEGSNTARAWLPAVPKGNYYLSLEEAADPLIQNMSYTLTVKRDVPYWGNYLLAICLVSLFPFCIFILWRGFETKRWSESDYAE